MLDVVMEIASAKNSIGWYSISDPSAINWVNPNASNGMFSFTPGGKPWAGDERR